MKKPRVHTIWNSCFDMADWEKDVPQMISEGYISEDADEEDIEEYCRELHYQYLDDERVNMNFPCLLIATGGVQLWNGVVDGYGVGHNLNECFDMSGVRGDFTCHIYVKGQTLYGRFAHHDCPTGYTLKFYIVKEHGPGVEKFREMLFSGEKVTLMQIKRCCYSAGRKVKEIYGF